MEENIDQIMNLALVGGLMAVFVLWMFLKNVRIVAFIALAIPISIFTAFNLFYAYDITLNSLTLVGMALAVGMLLDNSVVVLENIYRLAGQGKVRRCGRHPGNNRSLALHFGRHPDHHHGLFAFRFFS